MIVESAPDRWAELAGEILASEYRLEAELVPLPGENRNFLVSTADGERSVLKIATEESAIGALELEHAVLEHVAGSGLDIAVGSRVCRVSSTGSPGVIPLGPDPSFCASSAACWLCWTWSWPGSPIRRLSAPTRGT
jgi:hypothetical protein